MSLEIAVSGDSNPTYFQYVRPGRCRFPRSPAISERGQATAHVSGEMQHHRSDHPTITRQYRLHSLRFALAVSAAGAFSRFGGYVSQSGNLASAPPLVIIGNRRDCEGRAICEGGESNRFIITNVVGPFRPILRPRQQRRATNAAADGRVNRPCCCVKGENQLDAPEKDVVRMGTRRIAYQEKEPPPPLPRPMGIKTGEIV